MVRCTRFQGNDWIVIDLKGFCRFLFATCHSRKPTCARVKTPPIIIRNLNYYKKKFTLKCKHET